MLGFAKSESNFLNVLSSLSLVQGVPNCRSHPIRESREDLGNLSVDRASSNFLFFKPFIKIFKHLQRFNMSRTLI